MPEPGQIFQPYQRCKIAIYGLGLLTERLLPQLEGYRIVGLLDGYRTEGTLYGQPILSLEQAVKDGVELIIVAARPESCKIIAKRIGEACRTSHIVLLDIRGEDLCAPKKGSCRLTLKGLTKEELLREINSHDVVSVDLFDTLLMRRTLFPTDVFEILDGRLQRQGVVIADFPKKRLEGEKQLCRHTVPTLAEIYEYICSRYHIHAVTPEALAAMEWEVDRDLAVPRRELCALLSEAYRRGKPVFITSDTFYSKAQLVKLLSACRIDAYTDILPSCEYRTGKTQGLFAVLRQRIHGKTCVHIGDSDDADVCGAEKNGLTGCRIYSGLDLFENVGYLGLWEEIGGLSSRIRAGMLVSKLFNSPFPFERADPTLHVDSAYDIGYLFYAPILSSFVFWLRRQVEENNLKNVWFCARDGYLIKKLYDRLGGSVASVYFLTSRTAAIRAGVEHEADIRYVEEMHFSGSLEEELKQRFGITVADVDARSRLTDCAREILAAAKIRRNRYSAYIRELHPEAGDIAFFDFVARGTTQLFVGRLLNRHLRGYYFLQQDQSYMEKMGLDIRSFCRPEENTVSRNYYILEPVVTAPEPSVLGFTADGEACYAHETRTAEALCCVETVQDGIEDYFREYLRLCPEHEGDKPLGTMILNLIHSVDICAEDYLALQVEDPFFGRNSPLADLL